MSGRVRKLIIVAGALAGAGLLGLVGLDAGLTFSLRRRVHEPTEVPERSVGIVFGAGLGSSLLRDRVETGVRLLRAGKVRRLLLSGDNRARAHDEPRAMRRIALAAGVPESALVLDYAGRRTFDTCARAREIFGVESAILVTQRFHLTRALYLCRKLGLDVVGVPAEDSEQVVGPRLRARELLAVAKAWFDINIHRPFVVGGPAIPLVDPPPASAARANTADGPPLDPTGVATGIDDPLAEDADRELSATPVP